MLTKKQLAVIHIKNPPPPDAKSFFQSLSPRDRDYIMTEGFDWMDWLDAPPPKEWINRIYRMIQLWEGG